MKTGVRENMKDDPKILVCKHNVTAKVELNDPKKEEKLKQALLKRAVRNKHVLVEISVK